MNKHLDSIAFQQKERGGAGNCFYDSAGAEVGMSGRFFGKRPQNIWRNPDENEKISLSLCVCYFLSFSDIFFLSFSHTIFLHLSQIFKANITIFVAMKINGDTEDCFPDFFFLSLISFFTLSLSLTNHTDIPLLAFGSSVCRSKLSSQPSLSESNVRTSTRPFLRYPSHSESYIRTSTRNLLAVAVVCRSKLSSQEPSRSHLIFEQEHLFLSLLFPLEIELFS